MGRARGNRDDRAAAAACHDGDRRAHAVEDALDVDVDDLAPGVGVGLAQMGDRLQDAGVADQDVEPSEGLDRGIHSGLDLPVARDVAWHGQGVRPDLAGQFGDAVFAARNQHHLGAGLGQDAGGGFADAAACAGNQRDFVCQIGHVWPFRLVSCW